MHKLMATDLGKYEATDSQFLGLSDVDKDFAWSERPKLMVNGIGVQRCAEIPDLPVVQRGKG